MAGVRSRHRMRCNKCRRAGKPYKFTLRRPPSKYTKPPKCPVCKSSEVIDYEATYRKTQALRPLCDCNAVPHPHRLTKDGVGTHRMCIRHPKIAEPLTWEEESFWDGVLLNPRRTSRT